MKFKIIFLLTISVAIFSNIQNREIVPEQKKILPIFNTAPVRAKPITVSYFSFDLRKVSRRYSTKGYEVYCLYTNTGFSATVVESEEETRYFSLISHFKETGWYYLKKDNTRYYVDNILEEKYNICSFVLTDIEKNAEEITISPPMSDSIKPRLYLYKERILKKATYLPDNKRYDIIGDIRKNDIVIGIIIEKTSKLQDRGTSFINKKGDLYIIINTRIEIKGKKTCICKKIILFKRECNGNQNSE